MPNMPRRTQNQFFISGCANDTEIGNRVADAILKRILRADREGTPFRVYIIMSLIPGMQGPMDSFKDETVHAIMHWQYRSMCRGGNSLLERLARKVKEPWRYISFFGLRQHALMPDGRPVTEQVRLALCRVGACTHAPRLTSRAARTGVHPLQAARGG